jgi:hypothetical protein
MSFMVSTFTSLGTDLSHTFTRSDSNSIGATENIKSGRWVEYPENVNGDLIRIRDDYLYIHYFASQPSVANLVCSLGGVSTADIDFSVKIKPYSADYGGTYGVSYRMPSQTSRYLQEGAYFVRLKCNTAPNKIYLYYGQQEVANADVLIPTSTYSTLRVIADGDSHKVYFDGTLMINTIHSGNIKPGYIGLFCYYSIARFDDFELKRNDTDEVLSDDFNRTDSNEVGQMLSGGHIWNETCDNTNGDLIRIMSNTVRMHYFESSPYVSSLALNQENFQASDVDIRASLKPYSDSYGDYYGIGYRLASETSKFKNSDGYYAQLDKENDPDKLALWFGNTKIAEEEITIPEGYAELRVVAKGDKHCLYLSEGELLDDFDRAESDSAGSMSQANHQWQQNGENGETTHIKIYNNKLDFHYFRDHTTSTPDLSCNIEGYSVANVDLSVDLESSNNYGGSYGVGYRLASVSNRFKDLGGYYVQLNKNTVPNVVSLWFEDEKIAETEATMPDGSVTLRVLAVGPNHKIYIGQNEVLNVWDYNSIGSGYCGVFTWYSVARFNDFTVENAYPRPALVATHSGKTTEGYVGIFSFYSIINCDYFEASKIPDVLEENGQFMLGLYSMNSSSNMDKERCFGWSIGHKYSSSYILDTLLDSCHDGSMLALGNLDYDSLDSNDNKTPLQQGEVEELIKSSHRDPYLLIWNIPEELRYWRSSEWAIVTDYTNWIRLYDDWQRPNYMYLPGHYSAAAVEYYVPYLDILPSSLYADYQSKPRAWIRWRMEETMQAISDAGASIGDDYLNGEKIPVGVLQLFGTMNFQSAYHDFWQAVCCGARGIIVYSYAYRNSSSDNKSAWDAYCKAASELSGPENISDAMLYGIVDNTVSFNITSGPQQTELFVPTGTQPEIQYPSLNIRAVKHDGYTYIIVVNSATQSVSAIISNLPVGSTTAEVLFEGRSMNISNSSMSDAWDDISVHIYKVNGTN